MRQTLVLFQSMVELTHFWGANRGAQILNVPLRTFFESA
jgi:hypothetical protein